MKILILADFGFIAGGTERYTQTISVELHNKGHDIRLAIDQGTTSPNFLEPYAIPCHLIDSHLQSIIEKWQPDIVIDQGVDPGKNRLNWLTRYPVIHIGHDYRALCISGEKTWKQKQYEPCNVPLSSNCLLKYFPNKCGGRNPLTMIRNYHLATRRLNFIKQSRAIITLSSHMLREFQRLAPKIPIHQVPPPIPRIRTVTDIKHRTDDGTLNLVYMGRIVQLKGLNILLGALAKVSNKQKINLTVIGDGPAKHDAERLAHQLFQNVTNIKVEFVGWISDESTRIELLQSMHWLVIPSLWPEPYGLVGLEAGAMGIPSIAFDTGGIPSWLIDGRNGLLVPCTSRETQLTSAIEKACGLTNYSAYSNNARTSAGNQPMKAFIDTIEAILIDSLRSFKKAG